MRIETYRDDFQLCEYSLKRNGGEIALSWKYKGGSHFLIFLYDARRSFKLQQIIEEIEKQGHSDRDIVRLPGGSLHISGDGSMKVYVCREPEFAMKGQCYTLQGHEIKRGIPYGIRIFAAQYDREREMLHIYCPKEEEDNVQYIPVRIEPEIRYRPVLLSRDRICLLQIPYMQDYIEGALEYYVSGVRCGYPLSRECLGREIQIVIPRDAAVTVRVADSCKKYYRI
ncbi:MAG: hypothetical protein J6B43_01250 [Lachnospiraceae bacterium]|nr:hypothetical protein [Lachnospiraceae bacterium]